MTNVGKQQNLVSKNTEKEKVTDSKLDWFRMDNAATLFSLVHSTRIPCMYRLSSTLNESVDKIILQKALENIMPRFPYYNVNMRRGLFWFYWETNESKPIVVDETRYPVQKLPVRVRGQFPFAVLVYKNRISVEMHHSLTDGTGTLTFIRALIGEYFALKGAKVKDWLDIFRPGQKPEPSEYEDAFKVNYQKTAPDPKKIPRAFHLPFKLAPKGVYKIISGSMNVKEVITQAKKWNVTLTEYLVAVYLESLQKLLFSFPKKLLMRNLKPIRLMVPVNLRRMYQSKTMRNFSLYVTPGIDPRLGTHTFEEIIKQVYHYMRVEISDKYINQQIARNVRGEILPIVKVVPLFVKRIFGKTIYNGKGEFLYSGVLTNLGRVQMPEPINEEIADFQFIPAPSPVTKTGCAIASYNETLYVNWGRNIYDTQVEKLFFRKLVKDGIKIRIETN
ncbi:MAG: hypothetical protein ACTSWD_01845 [Candidatus Heimdallarchaeota archaeon]